VSARDNARRHRRATRVGVATALTAAAILSGLVSSPAQAHKDDYLDETLVYLTLERNELEAEYWLDRGRHAASGAHFLRHNVAMEWGITDHWMVDGRATGISDDGRSTEYDSSRVESRYRFLDEGDRLLDVAVSLEVNSERESDGSTTTAVEPRLIISHDFGEKTNLTLNLSEETPLDSGTPAFLAAFGNRIDLTRLVRVGSEFQYDFMAGAGAAIPQVWLTFPHEVTLKLGYSVGLGLEPDDYVRAALEIEF